MYNNMEAKMNMDPQQLMVLETEVKNRGKDMVVGYLLWWFLGLFGAHRFYMGRTGSAIAMLVLSITLIGMIATWVWMIVDAFLLHTWIKEHNQRVEADVIQELQYRYQ